MKDKIFGVLQRVGRSFMLPIALLPAAGLLLGIGSSFTNQTMLEAYHLTGVIYPGSALYAVLDIMNECGSVIFNNLALLFAMGVAIGMAKQEKEVAALSGAIAYLVMNAAIGAMISASGGAQAMAANSVTSTLGITTLQMGVFGGIVVGLGTAALHNRFYKIRLPQVLSFFGGTRFVPIICTAVYLVVGIVLFYVWPAVQNAIAMLGNLVVRSGYAGTFLYGVLERALIPFGLHHVFYMPFWQTALGGTKVINGTAVSGAQNIFFAELGSGLAEPFSVSATRFMAGKFPMMIFGLPGAALAMYRSARPEKRKTVGGLLISAALTSAVTGITEPIEFTFLFVAPVMYVVHCIYAGISYMLMHMLKVGVGMTFSGGLIDLTLFGILQGNAKTNWLWIIPVGAVYFFLYYLTFSLMIKKMNLKTPGRGDDSEEAKLFTRSDVQEKSKTRTREESDSVSALILKGLGGRDNLSDVDCCATRLRVTVVDETKVSDRFLMQSGASGVIHKGNGIQVVYGPQVSVIKSNLTAFLDTKEADTVAADQEEIILGAHMTGRVVELSSVADEAFASGAMGPGAAIDPEEGKLFAPADGVTETVFGTKHAVGMITDNGVELLFHIGIDTVKLGGRYFDSHVQCGQKVRKGDVLVTFDLENIKKEGFDLTTPVVVCGVDDEWSVKLAAGKTVHAGENFLELNRHM